MLKNDIGTVIIMTVVATTVMMSAPKAQSAMFKDVEVGITATTDFYNKYVWRGFLLDDDAVVEPSVTISAAGFEGGFWGNWDVEDDDDLKSNEVDGWIGYAFDLGFLDESLKILGFKFGHTWYDFQDGDTGLAQGAHSREFYVGATVDTFLSPYITWYHDYEAESSGGGNGDFLAVGIGHSFTLNEEHGVSLDVGYEFGYNSEAYIEDKGGYNLLTAGLAVPLTDNLTITPKMGYSMPYGDVADANNDEFYVGVSTELAI